MNYDIEFFIALNSLAGQYKIIDLLVIFLADYLPYLMTLFLLYFLFWPKYKVADTEEVLVKFKKDKIKNRIMVLVAILSSIISIFVVKNIILFFYNRPRPYIALPIAHKLVSVSTFEDLHSFPSGHAMFFFAMASAIYLYNKKWGIYFFVATILISISRVIAGVHYPSDILFGGISGILVACIVFYLVENYIGKKLKK